MGCPIDFRKQQRERWIEIVRANRMRDIPEIVDAIQADLRESQAIEAQEIERLRADIDSLRLALEGAKHCHRKDNEYLLDRALKAEAAVTGPVEIRGAAQALLDEAVETFNGVIEVSAKRMDALEAALSGDPE